MMDEKPYKPAGVPGIIPYLTVDDVDRALDFYARAFGFEKAGGYHVDNGVALHAEMKFLDIWIMLGRVGAFGSLSMTPKATGCDQGILLYVYCPDIDAQCERARAGGAKITQEPNDAFWGDRVFNAEDPDGYRWTFARNIGAQGAGPGAKTS